MRQGKGFLEKKIHLLGFLPIYLLIFTFVFICCKDDSQSPSDNKSESDLEVIGIWTNMSNNWSLIIDDSYSTWNFGSGEDSLKIVYYDNELDHLIGSYNNEYYMKTWSISNSTNSIFMLSPPYMNKSLAENTTNLNSLGLFFKIE